MKNYLYLKKCRKHATKQDKNGAKFVYIGMMLDLFGSVLYLTYRPQKTATRIRKGTRHNL
ncbi:MAG: hypothetical protein CMK06_03705 [Ponticaulis sp.]|nr:hypothetical protein [Ponticaulis sp.]